jgi:hypothetical protein
LWMGHTLNCLLVRKPERIGTIGVMKYDILRACLLARFSVYCTYINVMEDEWRKP